MASYFVNPKDVMKGLSKIQAAIFTVLLCVAVVSLKTLVDKVSQNNDRIERYTAELLAYDRVTQLDQKHYLANSKTLTTDSLISFLTVTCEQYDLILTKYASPGKAKEMPWPELNVSMFGSYKNILSLIYKLDLDQNIPLVTHLSMSSSTSKEQSQGIICTISFKVTE